MRYHRPRLGGLPLRLADWRPQAVRGFFRAKEKLDNPFKCDPKNRTLCPPEPAAFNASGRPRCHRTYLPLSHGVRRGRSSPQFVLEHSRNPANNANAVDFSPDGLHIIEAGKDQCTRIRDAKTLQVTREMLVHDAPVVDVAWHPSRPYVATTGEDLRVRIWDLSQPELKSGLVEEMSLLQQMPTGLQWSPDGLALVVSGQSKRYFFTPKSCANK